MSNFSINKVKQVDANFFKFLRDSTQFMVDYDNLLIGLRDLNKNHKSKRVVFVNSKCSNKGYICLNCNDDEFERILNKVEETINLHEYRMKESKKILSEFKN